MTMPDERLRAIVWGRELLDHVASDIRLDFAERSLASQIASTYPSRADLEDRLVGGEAGLASAWTTTLLTAERFFVHFSTGLVCDGQRSLEFTLTVNQAAALKVSNRWASRSRSPESTRRCGMCS